MNRLAAISLLFLAGCANGPAARSDSPSPAAGGLFAWTAVVDADAARTFSDRCRARLDAADGALLRTLVREGGELPHAIFLLTEDEALRSGLATALTPAHRASESARRGNAPAHALARAAFRDALGLAEGDPTQARARAADARDGFLGCRDALRAADAQLLAGALALEQGEAPVLPTRTPAAAQEAPLALLRLGVAWRDGALTPRAFRAAARVAIRTEHVAALRRLEALRTLGITTPARGEPAFDLEWSAALARSAIVRRQPLLAIRHGLTALRAAEQLGRPSAPARTRLAQAYLVAGEQDAALVEAQTAVDRATTPRDVAAARSVLGEALAALGRQEAAAESYALAHSAAKQAGDGAAAFRAALNRSLALLRAQELEDAGEALSSIATLIPSGPDAADLRARHRIVRALYELLSKTIEPAKAAERVDAALADARAAGCAEVVEAYGSLPERLRP